MQYIQILKIELLQSLPLLAPQILCLPPFCDLQPEYECITLFLTCKVASFFITVFFSFAKSLLTLQNHSLFYNFYLTHLYSVLQNVSLYVLPDRQYLTGIILGKVYVSDLPQVCFWYNYIEISGTSEAPEKKNSSAMF